jgi:DUF438 domain-containing protein
MDWQNNFTGSIIVCDKGLNIIYLNEKAKMMFDENERDNAIGKNLLDCHNEESNKKINEIKENLKSNVYTIEKAGKTKLIYQSPLTENNEFKGIVEFSLEIPEVIPHFKRD